MPTHENKYKIELAKAAIKALDQLPDEVADRLYDAIEDLSVNPRPNGCKKLKGKKNQWRIRSGDYRVIYQIRDEILLVLVLKVGNRKDIYK